MFVKPPKIVGTVEVIDVVDSIPRVVVRLRDFGSSNRRGSVMPDV